MCCLINPICFVFFGFIPLNLGFIKQKLGLNLHEYVQIPTFFWGGIYPTQVGIYQTQVGFNPP
jgi:hypothetical protein